MIRHKDYLLVSVAPQAKDFEIDGGELYYKAWFGAPDIGHMKKLPPGSWQLIGLAAQITDKQKWDIIERSSDGSDSLKPWFRNYEEVDIWTRSCPESFDSLLRSYNLNASTTVILKLIQP